jgi:hypothetical protein
MFYGKFTLHAKIKRKQVFIQNVRCCIETKEYSFRNDMLVAAQFLSFSNRCRKALYEIGYN